MTKLPESRAAEPAEMPLGQRLYDNWMLLMIAGIVIMAVIYTGWGLWEIYSMPKATLP
ncbi:MAG TPA: hypothetical protein VK928_10870 [Longimicrobiales bacterium]|nr:hypothetical protein [Longimicrobiales bacterium]